MQLTLIADVKDQPLTKLLEIVYSWSDAGSRFTADDTTQQLTTNLDGSKLLTVQQYNAINAVTYDLKFAVPPVQPS